ncbi:MAG: methyl-accepting chemotaxis protein, partial [Cellvibrionaceae bacterium]|nr:methyl-accepting chemotaxis protein [Cellvibrionaceae bacterium]
RGFAVVADEVRTLAQRTQDSTAEIQNMIEGLQVSAKGAVSVMDQSRTRTAACVENTRDAGDSLGKITNMVNAIAQINSEIANSTKKQHTTIASFRHNIDNINQYIQQTAEGSRETAASCEQNTQLTQEMKNFMSRFKVE